MKTRSLLLMMTVMIFIAIIAVPAQAAKQKTVFADGSYIISETTATAVQPLEAVSGARMSSTSGWGGTAASSGARSAWISTKFYSILGTHLCTVKTGVRWEWRDGVITSHTRYEPTLSTFNQVPLTSITMTRTWGESWWFTWNGKAHGGWYTSVKVHLEQNVFKYGTLGTKDLFHEYKEQANGRYWWRATT